MSDLDFLFLLPHKLMMAGERILKTKLDELKNNDFVTLI